MAVDHRARARLAWPILVRAASQQKRVTYGELCSAIGIHPRGASYFLAVIHRYCELYSLPPLVALAVSSQTHHPSAGYTVTPRSGPAYEAALEAVYAYPWPTLAPRFALV